MGRDIFFDGGWTRERERELGLRETEFIEREIATTDEQRASNTKIHESDARNFSK